MIKHLIIIPLVLIFGALLFAKDISRNSVQVLNEPISSNYTELEKKQNEIEELKNELKSVKSGRDLHEAGVSGGIDPEAFLIGLSSILAAALCVTLMKKNKKPELCRCAKRREMMQKRIEEQKFVSINNC
jgi:hypothetical protein